MQEIFHFQILVMGLQLTTDIYMIFDLLFLFIWLCEILLVYMVTNFTKIEVISLEHHRRAEV